MEWKFCFSNLAQYRFFLVLALECGLNCQVTTEFQNGFVVFGIKVKNQGLAVLVSDICYKYNIHLLQFKVISLCWQRYPSVAYYAQCMFVWLSLCWQRYPYVAFCMPICMFVWLFLCPQLRKLEGHISFGLYVCM